MLPTPSDTFYSKVQFKTEEEIEKVVARNFKLLFGDYSILLPKKFDSDFWCGREKCGDELRDEEQDCGTF
jgi:hypothetical protein